MEVDCNRLIIKNRSWALSSLGFGVTTSAILIFISMLSPDSFTIALSGLTLSILMLLAWVRTLGKLCAMQVDTIIWPSFILAAVFSLLSNLALAIKTSIAFALCIASLSLLIAYSKNPILAPECTARPSTDIRHLVKPLAYLFVYASVYGASIAPFLTGYLIYEWGFSEIALFALGLLISALTIAIKIATSYPDKGLDALTRLALVVLIIGMLAPVNKITAILSPLFLATGIGLFLFMCARMSIDLRTTFELNAWIPPLVLFAYLFFLFLVALLYWFALSMGVVSHTTYVLISIILLTIVTVYGLSGERVWVAQDIGNDERKKDVIPTPWKSSCLAVANAHGLTPRETEVFMLLAKGRNTAFIEEELVVSKHTVKSHVLNIYRKLDVHSAQELIDLVESEKASQSLSRLDTKKNADPHSFNE